MASVCTAVLLVCFLYMVCGASVYKQYDIKKTSRDIRTVRRAVHIAKRSSSVPTFETETVGRNLQTDGNPVFLHSIERHTGIFLDSETDITFQEKMKKMYETRTQKWKLQRDVIVKDSRCDTRELNNSDNAELLYKNIIKLYTRENGCMYREVNTVLRDYRQQSDSSLGSFPLMLNVVLTEWTSLSGYTGTTYRGVLGTFDIDPYTINTIFTWTSFTSSSNDKNVACGFAEQALFIIDNSAVSDWRPTGIKDYSDFSDEEEYLYPATVMFKVTSVEDGACGDDNMKTIHISLQAGDSPRAECRISRASDIGRTLKGGACVIGRTLEGRASVIGRTLKGTIALAVVAAIVVIFE